MHSRISRCLRHPLRFFSPSTPRFTGLGPPQETPVRPASGAASGLTALRLLALSLTLSLAPQAAWSQQPAQQREAQRDQRGDQRSDQNRDEDREALTPEQSLDNLRKQITAIQNSLKDDTEEDDATLSQMRADSLAASAEANRLAGALAPQLTGVQARLAELGKPVAGAKEAPDVAEQRTQLDRSAGALDAQVKLARLLAVEADQASEQISTLRRSQLQARLFERTAPILVRPFWSRLQAELPQNMQRLRGFVGEITASARTTPWTAWAGILAAMAVLLVARIRAGIFLLSVTSTKVPHGRLRRSVHALLLVLLAMTTPAIVAGLLKLGVSWNGGLADKTAGFLSSIVGMVSFSGFVAGLGKALLSPGRPSWRLLPLSDRLAHRMRRFPLVLSIVMLVVWSTEQLAVVINAGLSTAVAINCIVALLLGATLAVGLLRAERVWRKIRLDETEQTASTPLWVRVVVVVLWIALATSLVSLLIGYVAFGSFIAKQAGWILVVVCVTYLLTVLMDDICMLLSSSPPDPDAKNPVLATPKARDQAAVLLSAGLRTTVVLLAVMLLLAPFGEGPAELFHRVGQLNDGLAIGEIQIRPGAVIQALIVLVLGFLGLRLFKQWLEKRYLPTTSLDAGMQVSALTLFGYIGGIAAVALAMSAAGIGLERIAWVASALSVGIGFGLQAVVQNFVSGLILLAERPVKVGDWVSLGGVEGDIRRINVRATEIQMGDRSTVIVPNSEFITKTVRNVTHASPLGLVSIKLPLPLDTDAEDARVLILGAFVDNPDVLDNPAPNVQLDAIDSGHLMFNASGFVSSPRLSYGVRSALLFELLKRLHAADMPISKPNTMILSGPAALPGQTEPAVAPLAASPPAAPLDAPLANTGQAQAGATVPSGTPGAPGKA